MAFQLGTIDFLVKSLLPRLAHRGKVVSLGRQMITAPPTAVREYLRERGFAADVPGYNWKARLTSRELFTAMGFAQSDDLDFTADEGCSIVHDLNRPLPVALRGAYDLVFEVGTIEHVFDMRQVFDNIVSLTKVGGTVFHLSPLTWINHGFYNFSLTLFYDVYRCNGFENMQFFLVAFPAVFERVQTVQVQPMPFTPDLIVLKAPEGHFLMVSCAATKARDVRPFQVPIQAAYDPALRLSTKLKTFAKGT
jgi:hypothetical protein